MINYRLSAAASVDYVTRTSVQTHVRFIDAAFPIFPAASFQFMPTSLLLSIAHNIILQPLRILVHEKLSPAQRATGNKKKNHLGV